MPKKIVCRELGPPESLRLETFAAAPLAPGQVRVAVVSWSPVSDAGNGAAVIPPVVTSS